MLVLYDGLPGCRSLATERLLKGLLSLAVVFLEPYPVALDVVVLFTLAAFGASNAFTPTCSVPVVRSLLRTVLRHWCTIVC